MTVLWTKFLTFLWLIANRRRLKTGLNWQLLFWENKHAYHFGRLCCIKRRERTHKPAGISWLQCTTRRDQCVGADTANHQHRKTLSEKRGALVLFCTPSGKTTKAISEEYAGELSHETYQELIVQLKRHKFSIIVSNHRHPYGIKINNI